MPAGGIVLSFVLLRKVARAKLAREHCRVFSLARHCRRTTRSAIFAAVPVQHRVVRRSERVPVEVRIFRTTFGNVLAKVARKQRLPIKIVRRYVGPMLCFSKVQP